MDDYIKKILEETPHDMDGTEKTPAASHLFNINYRAKKLSEEKAQSFQHIDTKLLYLHDKIYKPL